MVLNPNRNIKRCGSSFAPLFLAKSRKNVGNPIAGRDINIVVRHDQVLCYWVGIVVVVVLPIFE